MGVCARGSGHAMKRYGKELQVINSLDAASRMAILCGRWRNNGQYPRPSHRAINNQVVYLHGMLQIVACSITCVFCFTETPVDLRAMCSAHDQSPLFAETAYSGVPWAGTHSNLYERCTVQIDVPMFRVDVLIPQGTLTYSADWRKQIGEAREAAYQQNT